MYSISSGRLPAFVPAQRRSPRRTGSTALFILAVLVVMATVIGAIVYFFFSSGSDEGERPLTVTPMLGAYDHVVLEQGEVESSKPVEVKCKVKSRGGSSSPSTKIIWVIPEGSVVEEGEKLLELDSASLNEERSQQNIKKLASEAIVIQAKAIRDTARIAKKEYVEATYKQEQQVIQNEIFVAEENLRKAQLAFESTQRSVARGFLTALQLEGEQFRVDAARNELELARSKLGVLEKYTREKMLTQLNSDIEAAEVSYTNEEGVLKEEIKKLAEIDQQIVFCVVTAPAAGQVVYANVRSSRSGSEFVVEEGAPVRENQVLVRLPDPTEMQVKANINESRIGLVHVGLPVSIRIDAFGDGLLRGEVTKVNKYPEPGNWWSSTAKQYATLIKINTPPPEIRSGLTAEVRIHVKHTDKALQIPVQALYEHKGHTFCLVDKGDHYETRRIVMDSTNDKMIAVDTDKSDALEIAEAIVLNPRQHAERFDFSGFADLPSDDDWAKQATGGSLAAGRPGAGQPGAGQPGAGQPGAGRPGAGRPGAGRPGAGQPGAGRPSGGQPGAGQPGAGRPSGGQPGAGQPGAGRPGAGRPGAGKPGGSPTAGGGATGQAQPGGSGGGQ